MMKNTESSLENQKIFTEEDFTEEELMLLKMAFRLVNEVVEIQRIDRYDNNLCNSLFCLKEKLGINDLIDD